MADVTTKTHAQLVQLQAAAVQSQASGLLDFSKGSILRAVIQAVGGVALWLQALVLAVLAMTRLATSKGADVDSFIADFAGPYRDGDTPLMARLGAAGSTGQLLFSRLTSVGTALIPLGAAVETPDGSQRAYVIEDDALASWRPDLGGYLMGDGIGSLMLPAQAVTAGVASNVVAGGFSVIVSAIPGVDQVTNPADFTGGQDVESDEALKIRFRGFIRALREATPAALIANAQALQPGARAALVEFQDLGGAARIGFGFLVIDDGTGYPSAELQTAAAQAMRDHRAAGVQIATYPPTVIVVNVAYDLTLAASDHTAADIAAAEAAVRDYIDGLGLGAVLELTRLYGIIYGAADTITRVASVTLNGATADITPLNYQMVKTGTVTAT